MPERAMVPGKAREHPAFAAGRKEATMRFQKEFKQTDAQPPAGQPVPMRPKDQKPQVEENKRVVGQWCGRGAEWLGLSGEVTHDAFELMRQCHDPLTGEMLRQRVSADRLDENGQVITKGRSLYDFTFSAPKSVSIMAIL